MQCANVEHLSSFVSAWFLITEMCRILICNLFSDDSTRNSILLLKNSIDFIIPFMANQHV